MVKGQTHGMGRTERNHKERYASQATDWTSEATNLAKEVINIVSSFEFSSFHMFSVN
jgi:hypothetical protein